MTTSNGNEPEELPPPSAHGAGPTREKGSLSGGFGTSEEKAPAAPKHLGPYRILELLGQGGMGTVYKAEQRSPIKRIVAIKCMKPGLDSGEVLARFESERQALARMNHRHIAKVLDASTDDLGRPYFVMEYVPGSPITQFADRNKLSIEQRLELFAQVCEAIAHAHSKAIIHRDIKPGNVLAYMEGETPVVKVIDFGIAKALTGERLTDQTFNTDRMQVIGTYDSMSPEQADGSPDIDTATDVYSLGVLLYELLTGAKPFDHETLAKAGEQELRRIIRDVEPPRPSTRISGLGEAAKAVAAARRSQVDALAGKLRSELEWIPLMAMRKERARRYSSVQALEEDVANYLADRPLRAGPESAAYRLRKLARRNRAAVLTGILFAVLAAGSIGMYIHTIHAAQIRLSEEQRKTLAALEDAKAQEQEARRQAAVAEAVSKFQTEMLGAADPSRLLGEKVTVLQATREAIKKLDGGSLKDQPLVEAAVRDAIGSTLTSLARYEEAEPELRRSLELRRKWLPASDPAIARSLMDLGNLLLSLNRLTEAEEMFREAAEIERKNRETSRIDFADSLLGLANALSLENHIAETEPLYREAVQVCRDEGSAGKEDLGVGLEGLANVMVWRRELTEAERLYREALQVRREVLPAGHPAIAGSLSALGELLRELERYSEAEPLLRESLSIMRTAFPEGHPEIADAILILGLVLLDEEKFPESEALLRDAVMINLKTRPNHPSTIAAMNNLAVVLEREGRPTEAEALYRQQLEKNRGFGAPGYPRLATSLDNMGNFLFYGRNRPAEAEPFYREAVDVGRKGLPAWDPVLARYMAHLGNVLMRLDRSAEAEPLLREALATDKEKSGDEYRQWQSCFTDVLIDEKKFAEATALIEERVAQSRKEGEAGQGRLLIAMCNLGNLFHIQKKLPESEAAWREAIAIQRNILKLHKDQASDADMTNLLKGIGELLTEEKKPLEAEQLFRDEVEAERKAGPDGHLRLAMALYCLAGFLENKKPPAVAEATTAMREALEIYRKEHADKGRIIEVQQELMHLLQRDGKFNEAESAMREALEFYRQGHAEDDLIARTEELLTSALSRNGKLEEAETVGRDALGICRKGHVTEETRALTEFGLGEVLVKKGNLAEAEPVYREALTYYAEHHGLHRGMTSLAAKALMGVLRQTGRSAEADELARTYELEAPASRPATRP